jgi:hypothetical protein
MTEPEALELIDVQRFDDALRETEAGHPPQLDPREDPDLTASLRLASILRSSFDEPTSRTRFQSYARRSKGYVLYSVAPPRTAWREPWHRRPILTTWLAPVASAAAAAVLILSLVALGGAMESSGQNDDLAVTITPVDRATATDLVRDIEALLQANDAALAANVETELNRINVALGVLQQRAAAGDPADPDLLESITVSTAAIADQISRQPDSLTEQQVIRFLLTASDGRTVLNTINPPSEGTVELSAARRAAQDGVEVASRYVSQNQASR